jgi:diguanylate cyclase (GGDEF)-like protein
MRFETILLVGGASAFAGALLVWLIVHPRFNRLRQNIRMRDWALAHAQAEHADRQMLFQTLMEDGPQVVVRLDGSGSSVYVSPSCRTVFGYGPSDMPQRCGLDLLHTPADSCLRVRHRDGRTLAIRAQSRPLPDGHGAALILTDVTAHQIAEARLTEARAQLAQRAERDVLTGLANRDCFLAVLGRALTDKEDVAVLLVDLDGFRRVNDRYGHDTGDSVLREVAARLTLAMVGEPLVARLGDDDFAVLLRVTDGDAPLAARARDLIRMLEPPVPTGTTTAKIGASIGISAGPRDGARAGALLRAADIAMTHARSAGGNTYRFFEAHMAEAMERADELRRELPGAIAAGEIVPYFQPLVRMDDTSVVGFEVLARWEHPVLGVLPPMEFLPLVEETGQSAAMFASLLVCACQAARDWPAHIKLSVNISPIELQDETLPDIVANILASTDFRGDRLEVEITENALIHDAKVARQVLDRLRRQGLSVALDDFGTGYSSLYHLRELPFDKVKIDKVFMRGLASDPEASRYVAAIIDFGHALGLDLTAEGIEDAATMNRLRELGCTYGQGYLFGKPMPAEAASRMLSTNRIAEMAAD